MVERGTVDNKCKAKSDDFQSARTVPLWPELSLPATQLFLLTFLLKSLGELCFKLGRIGSRFEPRSKKEAGSTVRLRAPESKRHVHGVQIQTADFFPLYSLQSAP